MFFVILVLVAVAAFWFWSVNGAKNTKRKVVIAFLRAMEDRVADEARQPSWWRDQQMQHALGQALASVPAKASPYDPDVVREWLGAYMTKGDLSTFLYHAETLGFSPSEQIALAPEIAVMFLSQDLIKAADALDKMLMLRLVASMKKGHGQDVFDIPEFSYAPVAKFFRDFGATDDRDDEFDFGPTGLYAEFPFRTGKFHSTLVWSDDPRSVPEVLVYNYEP